MHLRLLAALAFAATVVACGGQVDFSVADAAPDGGPDGASGCPSVEPTPSSDCSPDGLTCTFGSGACPDSAECVGGKWLVEEGDCDAPAPPPHGCPSTLPIDGASCFDPGLTCAYGDDPRPSCRSSATCTGGSWQYPPEHYCPPLPKADCPPSASDAQGKTCSVAGALCTYGDVDCGCTACAFGGPCSIDLTWACDAPPTTPGCPPSTPNLGTACTSEGTTCTYGTCGVPTLAGRTCTGGVWVDSPIACAE